MTTSELPENYKSLPEYKNAPAGERTKLNHRFRKEQRARDERRQQEEAAKKEASFMAERFTLELELSKKVMQLMALQTHGSAVYAKVVSAPRQSGNSFNYRSMDNPFEAFTQAITLEANAEARHEVLLTLTSTDDCYCYASGKYPLFSQKPTSRSDFERMESAVAQRYDSVSNTLDMWLDYLSEVERAERERQERNAARDKLRASLDPALAALVTPNE